MLGVIRRTLVITLNLPLSYVKRLWKILSWESLSVGQGLGCQLVQIG